MISWEHVAELALSSIVRKQLRNRQHLERFDRLRYEYRGICEMLSNGQHSTITNTIGYDWGAWVETVRSSFERGVPLGFLRHPLLAHTMVFARRRGISLSRLRIDYVIRTFGVEESYLLLSEDYIGLPTITDVKFFTSANRSHHASHLAGYTRFSGKKFWETSSVVEWGGGYGDMARIVRRMNSKITYVIVDLPEILALQYIYLASLEGEDSIHVIKPGDVGDVCFGKINLVPVDLVFDGRIRLQGESFISTWALTESQPVLQHEVLNGGFFGAKNILIGSMINENNVLAREPMEAKGFKRVAVPSLGSLSAGNEYWFV